MKKSVLFFCLITFLSCSNEFELNAPAKEIPIVYALLSRADEVHYIRVEKAFIDEQTSALELAQRPEELYFDTIVVEIVREKNGEAFVLEKIDGSQIGLERTEGIFATTPNILYKIDAVDLNLQEKEKYRLNIRQVGSDNLLTTAITPIVSDIRLNRPISGGQKPLLRILEDDEISIFWRADETAKLFDVNMVINYEEFDPADANSIVKKSIKWTLANNMKGAEGFNQIEPKGIEFYQFLNASIPVNTNLQRVFKTIDIRIDAGGEELFNYINVGQANTGITSAQIIPNYTNLSSGLGLFASRNAFIATDFVLDAQSKAILQDSDLTRDLNFR